ncbi:hypothetical protein VTN00DRAFT_3207 [Thermoascus crustaceus]|uniref:uncharacterized protein n=1 Tax=Thermoascus crustaceus TaxID=5088 RepID=UPI003743C22D
MAPKEWVKVDLDVPDLGTITGLCFDQSTCQYLGVPYAVVPGRFRRPQPAPVPWPEKKWDGTKLGPFCAQPPRDFYPIPSPPRPWVDNPPMSSTDCLNLNISVPTPPSVSAGKPQYPVMVFLHGGAFVYAAGGAAIYDGRALAEVSQRLGVPTIIIAINFRLGVYGFLASKEIQSYNHEFGEDGVGNYGLWDQIEALRWVQKHISAFGGDPERVTLFGQSAGGVSTNVHLLREEKLFSSAIIQSGLLPLCGVMSAEQYQAIYDKLLDVLEIPKDLPPRERLRRLVDIEEEKLTVAMIPVCITPVITFSLCDDHYLIGGPMPKHSDYSKFKAPSWCQRILIGDVANECVIWNKGFRGLDAAAFIARIKSFLKDDTKAQKFIDLYKITPDMDRTETFYKIEKFTTDGLYTAVNWSAVRANPQIYAYHFDVPSPFDNEWGGLAHHSLDNVYVWSLLRDHLPPCQQRVSAQMAEYWLRFANGQEPWERFDRGGKFMIFENDRCVMKSVEEDAARGYAIWETIERQGLTNDFHDLCDELCMRREELTDSAAKPAALEVKDLAEYGIKANLRKVAWE